MEKEKQGLQGAFFGGHQRQIPHLTSFTRIVRRSPEHAWRRHHGQWSVDYHTEAAGEYSLDGRVWRSREAHTAHLYSAGCAYWERSSQSDVPFQETYILFSVQNCSDLDPLVATSKGFARFLDPEGLLANAFSYMAKGNGQSKPWRGQAALYDILDLLLISRPLTGEDHLVTTVTPPPSRQLVDRVEDYICAHYHEPLSLAAMALAAGVSVSTLTHRYHAETGRTPIDRLIEYRLDIACGMILKGALLKAVAAHTAFCDEFHLSKAFKHRFGLPPRRYAKQHAVDAPPFQRIQEGKRID